MAGHSVNLPLAEGGVMTAPAQSLPPGLVFAPARPRVDGGRKDVLFEMRKQPDGQLVLPVYSSVAGLVQALGHYQPWACVPLAQVRAALGGEDVTQVLVDPPVEPDAWRWSEGSLARSARYRGRHGTDWRVRR
jgi:hypothetical protein